MRTITVSGAGTKGQFGSLRYLLRGDGSVVIGAEHLLEHHGGDFDCRIGYELKTSAL